MKEETEPLKEKLINKVVIRRESTDDKSRVKSKLATVEKVKREFPTNNKEIVNCQVITDARIA